MSRKEGWQRKRQRYLVALVDEGIDLLVGDEVGLGGLGRELSLTDSGHGARGELTRGLVESGNSERSEGRHLCLWMCALFFIKN